MSGPSDRPGEDELAAAERALTAGEAVVLPTDTVFGIAARPDAPGATARLFEIKRRPRSLTLPVLVADTEAAWSVAVPDERAVRIAARWWPGALTIVLPRAGPARGWDLGEERDSVAVRVPDHPAALRLLRRTGPLAVTSANLSGQPTPADCDGARAVFGDAVAVYVCGPPQPAGTASAVVDLHGPGIGIVREGAIGRAEILETLR